MGTAQPRGLGCVPGTYLYFDEFNTNHELRAFDELMNETGRRFSLVGVTRTMAANCSRSSSGSQAEASAVKVDGAANRYNNLFGCQRYTDDLASPPPPRSAHGVGI